MSTNTSPPSLLVTCALAGPGRALQARDRLLRSFFSYFYFAINVGSCFSMILVPILRANVSYFSAFAAPAVLMMVALAIFYMGRKGYVHQPPSGNVVAEVLAIIWYALGPPREGLPVSSAPPPPGTRSGPSAATGQGGGEGSGQHVPGQSSGTPQGSGKGPLASEGAEEPLEVKRLLKRGSKRAVLPQGAVAAPHWLDCSKPRFGAEKVEDVKQVLRVLLLFLPTPIFWSLWDQQASRWVFQVRACPQPQPLLPSPASVHHKAPGTCRSRTGPGLVQGALAGA